MLVWLPRHSCGMQKNTPINEKPWKIKLFLFKPKLGYLPLVINHKKYFRKVVPQIAVRLIHWELEHYKVVAQSLMSYENRFLEK